MKKSEIILAIIISAILWCIKGQAQYLPYNATNEITISTRDAQNFVEAFNQELSKQSLKANYLNKTSKALTDQVMSTFVKSPSKFTQTVKSSRYQYKIVDYVLDKLVAEEKVMKQALQKWTRLRTNAILPDVYFLVGNQDQAQVFQHGNLMINLATLGPSTSDPHLIEITKYYPEVIRSIMVTQQGGMAADERLLAKAIKEGSADFFTELISGENPNRVTFQYAKGRENEIAEAFFMQTKTNNYSYWFYHNDARSKELARYMGYKIVAAYYSNTCDKTQAINDILSIQDYERFLKVSGYENTLISVKK